jgi:putative transposase
MIFEAGQLYHIYNQGNDRQKIFFNRNNYLFFLSKIHHYIVPFSDILAWCLMPNHFHLMVYVKKLDSAVGDGSQGVTLSDALTSSRKRIISFNDSIGIMLRSYTRAINKQENLSGSLFRKGTKSICLTESKEILSSRYLQTALTIINNYDSNYNYPNICFIIFLRIRLEQDLSINLRIGNSPFIVIS